MVRDRTSEFRSQTRDVAINIPVVNSSQIEDQLVNGSSDEEERCESDGDMKEFYDSVDMIRQGLVRFKINIEQLDKLFRGSIAGKSNKVTDEMLNETIQLIGILRDRLKGMKGEIENEKEEFVQLIVKANAIPGEKLILPQPNAQLRIKINIQRDLTKRYLDLLQSYQTMQVDYENQIKSKMTRQIKLINPQTSDVDIENMITYKGAQFEILENKRDQSEASIALVAIKEQHRDILLLEQSILELHQIFIDISSLIETQNELVDQIEWNCEQASAWTGEATKNIIGGDNYVKKSRKRCCGCCACGGGAVCVACATAAGYIALTLAPLAACNVM